jgi:hypothetical protein
MYEPTFVSWTPRFSSSLYRPHCKEPTWGAKASANGSRTIAEHYVLESSHARFTDIRDLGDRVLGIGTLRFTGKGSGITSETPLALMVSYRNGLITHMKDHGDKDKALEAVGLSE